MPSLEERIDTLELIVELQKVQLEVMAKTMENVTMYLEMKHDQDKRPLDPEDLELHGEPDSEDPYPINPDDFSS